MSEPHPQASQVVPVIAGISRWALPAQRPGGPEPQAFAIGDGERCVLLDPLPLADAELSRLGRPEALLLTGPERQRWAWRLRKQLGVDVFAPAGCAGLEEAPDLEFEAGEALPGGLVTFHAPGPRPETQVLWLTSGPRGVVFTATLLEHDGGGVPSLAPGLEDPERARSSVERMLARLPTDVLCFLWGPPILADGSRALRSLLARLEASAEPARP